ncbi:MAG TPA: ATP-dependent metallopeptidase FtsH/Yme1/Tma family protein, partial [Solirubrobacteraceae bacterium]|nr:ATP-dependent metallopeptidase FtsH/Yme1/Tma family protein [Solirubrobacteraceae bacterium]
MSRFFKSAAFPILLVVVLAFLATKLIAGNNNGGAEHTYQTLVTQEIPRGEVKKVNIQNNGNALSVELKDKQTYEIGYIPQAAPQLIAQLEKSGVHFNIESNKSNPLLSILGLVLPIVIFLGFWLFIMNQVQGGGSKVMSFGKSRAKRLSADSPKITFRDVAGVDEAVEELHEIKEFLENPKKFQAL